MSDRNERRGRGDAPEPPDRWNPGEGRPDRPAPPTEHPSDEKVSGDIGSTHVDLKGAEIDEFQSARRLIGFSQVAAIVSFFIGGVVLSGAAVVCAVVGYRKLAGIAARKEGHADTQAALKRVGIMAIGLAGFALAVNIVALVILYPAAMQALQSGGAGSLFGDGAPAGTGNTTWG